MVRPSATPRVERVLTPVLEPSATVRVTGYGLDGGVSGDPTVYLTLYRGDTPSRKGGSNDRFIKVWNLELVLQTQSLDSHGSWIRSLATEKDVLCSASKDNTVKVIHTHTTKSLSHPPWPPHQPWPAYSPSPPSSLSPALGPLAWYDRCGI